jgi:DNA processing protein
MSGSDLPYWLALRRAGLGTSNFALLLARFGTIEAAWNASPEAIASAGLEAQYQRAVAKARATLDAEAELQALEKHNARALTWQDEAFPASLRDIPQSPPVLFVRGALEPAFAQAVAVVGTRRVSPYGRQACEHFCETLARAGVAIISGLARGIDTIAHRVALEHGAPTVAVLAGGIDQVYPRENAGLADRILEHGCIVSEYPVGIPARPDYFPRRNRILAGLARATLVVEAGEGSGALHTANWAFEQGKDVFAIPGSIFSRQSWGTNQLIRDNTARIVTSPEQLCEELNLLTATAAGAGQFPLLPAAAGTPPPPPNASPEELRILDLLADGPRHIDELSREASLPIAVVSATVQVMELKGLLSPAGPMTFQRREATP